MADMKVQVTLALVDEMSANAAKALDALAKGGENAARASLEQSQATEYGSRACAEASREAAQAAENHGRASTKSADDITRATKKAEKSTEGLANAAKRAGSASLNGLRRGLDGIKRAGEAAAHTFKGLSGVAAVAGTAAYAIKKPMEEETRYAYMANTAYRDRDVQGRKAGARELRTAVDEAVTRSGGKRADGAEALSDLVAADVPVEKAKAMLPTIQKFAVASGTSSKEIAGIVIAGLQKGMFTPDEIEKALNMALMGGKAGSVELADMAPLMPSLMAATNGMNGLKGYAYLIASLETAKMTAGSSAEAGTNLENLYKYVNSPSAREAFRKKKVNLPSSVLKAMEKGDFPLEAFVKIIDQGVLKKDKKYQAMQAKIAKAEGEEKKHLLQQQQDYLMGNVLGELVPEKRALQALVAILTNPEFMLKTQDEVLNRSDGEVEKDWQVMRDTTGYSASAIGNEADKAMSGALDVVGPSLRQLADAVTDTARQFPGLAVGVAGATTVLSSLAAGGAVYSAAGKIFGGGKGGGTAVDTRGATPNGTAVETRGAAPKGTAVDTQVERLKGAGQGVKSAAKAGSKTAALLNTSSKAIPLLNTAFAAYNILATEYNDSLTRAQKDTAHGGTIGGFVGAVAGGKAGAALGATVGSIAPGLGTAAGGVVGGIAGTILGFFGGEYLGEKAVEQFYGADQAHPAQAAGATPAPAAIPPPIVHNNFTVTLDGREIAASVMERIDRQSRRN